jgi:hypothetical protein
MKLRILTLLLVLFAAGCSSNFTPGTTSPTTEGLLSATFSLSLWNPQPTPSLT